MMTVREYNKAKQQKAFIATQIEELETERDETRQRLESELESQMGGFNAAISLLQRKYEELNQGIVAYNDAKPVDGSLFDEPPRATNNGDETKPRSRRGRRAGADVDANG